MLFRRLRQARAQSTRFALGRRSRPIATSILFKLRDDEAKRLEDEYSGFKPKAFTLDDARRGVIIRYAPPTKRAPRRRPSPRCLPGSLMWAPDGKDYDPIEWRDEAGQGLSKPRQTAAPLVEYFSIIRAAAYASILNIVPAKAWDEYAARRAFCEWLARVVRDGQAINANVVFSKASRAIIAEPAHAEAVIELICSRTGATGRPRGVPGDLPVRPQAARGRSEPSRRRRLVRDRAHLGRGSSEGAPRRAQRRRRLNPA